MPAPPCPRGSAQRPAWARRDLHRAVPLAPWPPLPTLHGWKPRPNLAPGAPEFLCRLSGRLESRGSILRRHSDSRLEVRQAAASSSSQYRSGRGLLIGELADGEPIMVAEGQVPPDEPSSYAFEELGNGLLAIFGLSQHALDRGCGETTTRDVDRHGILRKKPCPRSLRKTES